jgi:hypothetical protein
MGCNTEPTNAQHTNNDELQALSQKFKAQEQQDEEETSRYAKEHNISTRIEGKNGKVIELQKIENGIPMYYGTTQMHKSMSNNTPQ